MSKEGHLNIGFEHDNGKDGLAHVETHGMEMSEKKMKIDQEVYNPFEHRVVERPTTNMDTLVHLLKGSLGTGILAMPMAFHHAGYVVGIIGTIIIGFLCTYCIHVLLGAHYDLCKRKRVPCLTYPQIAEASLADGPLCMRKFSRLIYHATNIFLMVYVLGTCCVYTVFVASNIKAIADYWLGYDVDVRIYLLCILLPLIFINWIRNLKFLAPFSSVANVFTIISFCIICYYMFREPITLEGKRMVGPLDEFPLFFGTVLFALEAIYVIMPLENEMKTPQGFGGTFGVLNKAMSIIVVLYIGMGLFGYFKYGHDARGSLTLNLPEGEWLAQAAKGMLAFGIFVTHGLAGYVAIDITWTEYVSDRIKNHQHKTFLHYVVRTSVIIVTFLLAIAIPNLELFISLFGAFCLSSLGLAFPSIIECATYWDHMEGCARITMLLKNLILIFVGLAGLIIGTYTSLVGIIQTFSAPDT